MGRVNRQWGLRLWSKTNRTFGKGDVQQILFGAAYHIPYPFLWKIIYYYSVDYKLYIVLMLY